MKSAIYVTQPYLPPLDEFVPYLQSIWDNKVLTNGGTFHTQLENALAAYLGVKYAVLYNNGTIALICALKALGLTGEVITTPYSFVATSHSLLWNNLTPIFVDIDPVSLNIDPAKIEAAITSRTTAILGVHCYGHPCDVDVIQRIADKHGLKVIYDAAHAFGVEITKGSILNSGDLSILSFHATKVFNTFEGGAIICHDEATKNKVNSLKNFGIADETTVLEVGINGKMSEVNAAFGLLQLKYIEVALAQRKKVDLYYRDQLKDLAGIELINSFHEKIANYSYFPILINQEYPISRDALYEKLKNNNIYSRRYFYPLLTNFEMYKKMPSAQKENLPIASHIAEQVLCLPIYPDLSLLEQDRIIDIIKGVN
jgi:dTDP-4-amino-4,6-dideoxygalactose transaminase